MEDTVIFHKINKYEVRQQRRTFTASQLIKLLQTLPPDMPVLPTYEGTWGSFEDTFTINTESFEQSVAEMCVGY